MSGQPQHDTFEKPFWQVQGVFDPDGQEPDFSYTIGLHERGLPELHLWAQPELGDDPGVDWRLSNADRGHLLNEFAELAVRGRLGVGTELERRYDAGQVTLRFRVGPPGDRDSLEAYGVAPDALVLPVQWSLHRAPEGPRSALAAADEEAALSAYREITDGLRVRRPAPAGWTLPATPDFRPGQRFGPLTPVVLARVAQMWQADEEVVADLLSTALRVEGAGVSLSYPVAVARSLARGVGRSACLDDLQDALDDLVAGLTTRPAEQEWWRRVIRVIDPDWAARETDEADRTAQSSAHLLGDLLLMCLSVEVIADLADMSLLLHARGPWLSGLRHGDTVPGPAWSARPDVLAVVAELLAPLDAAALEAVARMHRTAENEDLLYADLCGRLCAWALVEEAGCPWEPTLSSLPGWQLLPDGAPHDVVKPLEEWATCIASALTHRLRLSNDEVQKLAAPFEQDLPLLEGRLNRLV